MPNFEELIGRTDIYNEKIMAVCKLTSTDLVEGFQLEYITYEHNITPLLDKYFKVLI